ncbi:hypothetical protein KAR91_74265 [Candidatus Pacearchaeota archaeon]|nr:hypothetical protein [Candidatus Pacearchaeota archaeon]
MLIFINTTVSKKQRVDTTDIRIKADHYKTIGSEWSGVWWVCDYHLNISQIISFVPK